MCIQNSRYSTILPLWVSLTFQFTTSLATYGISDLDISVRSPQQSGPLALHPGKPYPWGIGTIGTTNPQEFRFFFDTGAGDIMIPHYPSGTAGYNFTGVSQKKTQTEHFSSGQDQGPVYADDITLAGLTANNVNFMVIDRNLTDDDPGKSNAAIGMDYTTKSKTGTAGFFETLIMQNKVADPEFAFWIARDHIKESSSLTLGGRDTTKFTGKPIVANVTSQNYWTIHIDGASVNGADVGIGASGQAIVDTGNAGVTCNVTCAKAINSKIPGAVLLPGATDQKCRHAYPCNTTANFIPAIKIAGQSLAIASVDYNAGLVNEKTLSEMSGVQPGVEYCQSLIEGSGSGWAIGLPFMHNWYTIFHWGAETKGAEVGAGTAIMFAKAIP